MTRVGNTEQVMALVRNQLQRMAKREQTSKTGKVDRKETRRLTPRERFDALNSIEGLSDEEFDQGIVRALLTEEFGEQVSNSPGFQELVDRTLGVLRSDPQVAALLRRLREEL